MEKSPPPAPTNNGVTCSTCRHLRRISSLAKTESICVRYPPPVVGGPALNVAGDLQMLSTTQHNVTIPVPENWWCGEHAPRLQ